jgi:hypothetical protein
LRRNGDIGGGVRRRAFTVGDPARAGLRALRGSRARDSRLGNFNVGPGYDLDADVQACAEPASELCELAERQVLTSGLHVGDVALGGGQAVCELPLGQAELAAARRSSSPTARAVISELAVAGIRRRRCRGGARRRGRSRPARSVVVVDDRGDQIAGAVGQRQGTRPVLRGIIKADALAGAERHHGHVQIEQGAVALDFRGPPTARAKAAPTMSHTPTRTRHTGQPHRAAVTQP